MPTAAKKFCKVTSCSSFAVDGSYCAKHKPEMDSAKERKRTLQKRQYQKTRATTTQQGYGNDWRKVRNAYINAHPLCEEHKRRGVPVLAVMVDHIVPLSEGGDRLSFENLQSLCNDCHEAKHKHERWQPKKGRGV